MSLRKTLLTATLLSALSAPAFAESVKIGVPTWTGAQAIAHVLGAVVETRIGGKSNSSPATTPRSFKRWIRAKATSTCIQMSGCRTRRALPRSTLTSKSTVTLSSNPYAGNQGFCVSKDFAAANSITDIADLGRPDVAALMDSDGNGKGEMWIGAPGWASANVNEVKVRDYGLLDFIEPIRAEESVKTARIKDSIAKGEGYAFYCYKPHAVWYMFDVEMLSEPTFDPAKYIMIQPSDDADWYEKSSVATKDALKEVQIAWSNSLARALARDCGVLSAVLAYCR